MYSLKNTLNICPSSIFKAICYNRQTHCSEMSTRNYRWSGWCSAKKLIVPSIDLLKEHWIMHAKIWKMWRMEMQDMCIVKKGSVNVNPSNVFLCALHHCNHILGIKIDLEQKLCLSSYKLCVSSRKLDYFLKRRITIRAKDKCVFLNCS